MNKSLYTLGFRSALIAAISMIAFDIVQLLQVVSVVSFPLDEILIYGTSLCIVVPFVLAMLALYYITPDEKKVWSHAALLFSVIYAVFVTANYVVQLATVIPMKVSGNAAGIMLLEQTPHSLFWDFDAIGYIFMGLATLVALPALAAHGSQKWVRVSFMANAFVTPLIAFVYFNPKYSEQLLMLGSPWGITAPWAMLSLAAMFKKRIKEVMSDA